MFFSQVQLMGNEAWKKFAVKLMSKIIQVQFNFVVFFCRISLH